MRLRTAARGATLLEILIAICVLLSAAGLLFHGFGMGAAGLAVDLVTCFAQRIGAAATPEQGCGAQRAGSKHPAAGDYESPPGDYESPPGDYESPEDVYESPEERTSEKRLGARAGRIFSLPVTDLRIPIADLRELPSRTDPPARAARTPERSPSRRLPPKAIPRPEGPRSPVSIAPPERGDRVPVPERPIPLPERGEGVPLPERGERVPLPERGERPPVAWPGPNDGPTIGSGQFSVTDFGVDFEKAGLKGRMAIWVGATLGLASDSVCYALIRWKGGCGALGTGTGVASYFLADKTIPSSMRVRVSNGTGFIRPNEGWVDYRLVSFGLAWKSDWKGTQKMSLGQALTLLATTLMAADQAEIPLPVAAAVFSPGLDWEYDVACTNKSLETETCHIGTRLSVLGEVWGATNKTTAAIQTPIRLPREQIARFMSDDPFVKGQAYAEIAVNNLFNQPMLDTLKLAAISLNLHDEPASSVAPKGGFAYQRFGFTPFRLAAESRGAKFDAGPLFQVGVATLSDRTRYLTVRHLMTLTAEGGPMSVKPQVGPHFIVPIGSEDQPVDVSGIIELLSNQKAMDSLGADGRATLVESLRTGMDSGHLKVDPSGRKELEAALGHAPPATPEERDVD